MTTTKIGDTSMPSTNPLTTAPSGAAAIQASDTTQTLRTPRMTPESNDPNHGATKAHAARKAPIVTSSRPV